MTDKPVNYTPEMVEALEAGYDGSADEAVRVAQVSALADELGRKEASIRAKLTHLGLYVPKAPVEPKAKGVLKADLVMQIAAKIGADEDVVGSLEKATKVALTKVLEAL